MPTLYEVQERLAKDLAALPVDQRHWIEPCLVEARHVEVEDTPGEPVVVIAEAGSMIMYWSEFEEGWEAERPGKEGLIPTRGSNQFKLGQLIEQLRKQPP
jgi:hypothetical protein